MVLNPPPGGDHSFHSDRGNTTAPTPPLQQVAVALLPLKKKKPRPMLKKTVKREGQDTSFCALAGNKSLFFIYTLDL